MHITRHSVLWMLAITFAWPPVHCGAGERQSHSPALTPELFFTAGQFEVATDRAEWRDLVRERSVPIKAYYPTAPRENRCPVIVFSHGLGGSREGCEYLGRMWASHGFLSIHPQHQGSDEAVWKGKLRPIRALKESFEDPTSLQNRVADLQFVLNALEEHVANKTPLGQMADMNRVGIAGHAFGALAALSLGGQHVASLAEIKNLPDPRVKAILALSSPVLFDGPDHHDVYKDIRVPTLHMTGTNDDSPVGPTRAMHRRIPFDHMLDAERFLVTLSGADHLSFSGHLRDRAAKTDPHYQSRIAAASTAFWLAYLVDATSLQSWLAAGGIERIVGDTGLVEYREPLAAAQSAR